MLAYPNPMHDALKISTTGVWSITDMSGRLMASGNVPVSLPVSDWAAGIYLLRSEAGAQKIVKE